MRFRLATSGAGTQHAGTGIGNFFNALATAPLYEAQAAEDAQTAGSKRQLMESQIAAHLADAALKNTEGKALSSAPDILSTIIAGKAGTDVPTFNRWQDEIRTGRPTMSPVGGDPQADAPMMDTQIPAPVSGDIGRRLLTEYQRVAPALIHPKGYKVDDQAQASGMYQKQDVLDQVLSGARDPARVGQAVAAAGGHKLVDNIGNTGEGYNLFTGQGSTISPGLRTLFGDEGKALIGQRNAAAGASGAAAGLSTARKERVVGGYDKPVTLLDEDTGEATITRLPTGGEPESVGVAATKKGGVDATNAKERNRVVREVEKELGATAKDTEIQAEVDRRLARRGQGTAPAAVPKPAGPKPAPAAAPASIPPQAAAALKEGVHTKFGNGQTWTLQGGKPVQVR